jgi:hypothetical protein
LFPNGLPNWLDENGEKQKETVNPPPEREPEENEPESSKKGGKGSPIMIAIQFFLATMLVLYLSLKLIPRYSYTWVDFKDDVIQRNVSFSL